MFSPDRQPSTSPLPAFMLGFGILCLTCIPAAAQETADRRKRAQEDFELMKLFVEAYEQVDANYVRDVDRRELIQAAIRGMLGHLDEYSNYIPKDDVRRFDQLVEQEFGGIGVDVSGQGGRLTVVSPLPGTPAFRAGIRSGDVIIEVDGTSTIDFRVTEAVKVLQGPPGRAVSLKVRRPASGEVLEFTMVREIIQVPTVLGEYLTSSGEWEYMLDDNRKIGYIRLSHFSRHTASEMRTALRTLTKDGLNGLILDLRSNPGGLLDAAIEISDLFLESGEIVSIQGRNVPPRSWKAGKGDKSYLDFPIAILVNRFSASASEVLSACLQDHHRAVVVGERTWGKGSVQNVIRMESDDSALKLTTASYHRPSGVNIDRYANKDANGEWGVKPCEGYDVRISDEELDQWFRDRRQQESLRDADTPAPERTFIDKQLAKAIQYLSDSGVPGNDVPGNDVPETDAAAAQTEKTTAAADSSVPNQ